MTGLTASAGSGAVVLWSLACGLCLLPADLAAAEVLFDGRTFAGWEGDTAGVWRIEAGEIVAGSLDRKQEKNDFLCTTKRYGNFDLRLKIRLSGTEGFVNSGIQFRSERIPGSHEVIGYQADFGKGYDGALYDESRRKRMLATPAAEVLAKISHPGEWHDYRIRAEGARVQLWVNGIPTVDYTETEPGLPADGIIALQIHGNAISEVRFKDLVIEELPPSIPAVECRPRGGLPRFFGKAKAGGEVSVAYLGGSITAAPGWRVESLARLQETYPQARFREINAAIGGTGSDLGAFRVAQDVIAGRPDLVFIEFAVNDGGADPAQIQATMEGIVRQILQADPATDICFVYTLSEWMLPDLQAGLFQRSASAMESVADHYGIPSVHFGVEVTRRLAEGTLVFKGDGGKGEKAIAFDSESLPMVFSTDGVHPLVETGHRLYAEVLTRSLAEIAGLGGSTDSRSLPPPLRADNWETARMVPLDQAMMVGPWTRVGGNDDPQARSFVKRMPVLWRADAPGAAARFRIRVPGNGGAKARRAAIYDLLGPGGGMVEIQVDAGPSRKIPRIDGYCTYWRIATLPLGDLAPGEHLVEVRLTADSPDKRTILFEKNRLDLEKHPEKYAPQQWYAAALLIFGEAGPP
jgi:lysophospholipase L1-like esterase